MTRYSCPKCAGLTITGPTREDWPLVQFLCETCHFSFWREALSTLTNSPRAQLS